MQLVLVSPLLLFLSARQCNANLIGAAALVQPTGTTPSSLYLILQQPGQARGVHDILAVDVSPAMLEALRQRVGPASTLGNEAGVRTWLGDVAGLPAYQVCCGLRGSGPA